MRWLEERGVGFETGLARVPIVAGAVLFDLGVGDPGRASRRRRGVRGVRGGDRRAGRRGLRRGGHRRHGREAPDPGTGMKGGLGTASERHGDWSSARSRPSTRSGRIVDARRLGARVEPAATRTPRRPMWPIENTTLVCVGTNARLTRESALRLAYAAHDGIALAVRPAHTHWDGDVVFAFGTGDGRAGLGPAPGDGVERRRRGDPPRRPRGDRRPGLSGGGRGGRVTRTLAEAAADAATCPRCRLAETRTQVVFGVGDPDADLMFIGEAPGLPRGQAGRAVRRRRRAAADAHARRDRAAPRGRLHRATC